MTDWFMFLIIPKDHEFGICDSSGSRNKSFQTSWTFYAMISAERSLKKYIYIYIYALRWVLSATMRAQSRRFSAFRFNCS